MRKLLFFFLGAMGTFRKFFLRMKGKTEQDIHDQRIISGKSWAGFCDELKTAGNVLLSPWSSPGPISTGRRNQVPLQAHKGRP